MKKILITTLLLAIPFMMQAQIKIIERSSKKAPDWISAAGSDYFVASSVAPSIDEAKRLCIEDVKKQIISAVAENIKSSTSQSTSQTSTQNEIVEFLEEFDASFETRSAILPFITGISMSKVKGYYFEKSINKSTNTTNYSYSILYPFSSGELHMLIKKFLEQDAKMEEILNEQMAKIGNVNSTEEIDRAIAALTPLLDYFFDDIRIGKTKQSIEQLKKSYSYITLELVSSTPGEMVYAMMAEGNPMTSSVKPTFRSNCAMALMYTDMGDGTVKVTYDSEGCMVDEQNYIEISYRLPFYPLKKKIFPVMTKSPLRISATGGMTIKFAESEDAQEATQDDLKPTSVKSVIIEFQLDNRSSSIAKLTSMTLKINEITSTINIGQLSIDIAQGISAITIPYNTPLKLKEIKDKLISSHLSFTKGSVTIVNPANGEVQTIPLVMKYNIEQ